jgi:hypothetical protein
MVHPSVEGIGHPHVRNQLVYMWNGNACAICQFFLIVTRKHKVMSIFEAQGRSGLPGSGAVAPKTLRNAALQRHIEEQGCFWFALYTR